MMSGQTVKTTSDNLSLKHIATIQKICTLPQRQKKNQKSRKHPCSRPNKHTRADLMSPVKCAILFNPNANTSDRFNMHFRKVYLRSISTVLYIKRNIDTCLPLDLKRNNFMNIVIAFRQFVIANCRFAAEFSRIKKLRLRYEACCSCGLGIWPL